ncbi:MAG: P-II family nitrogen regulator [Nitrososphaerales archaeon]
MKRIEIIIPDRKLHDLNAVLKEANVGGMNYHRIDGRGKTKAQPIAVGRGVMHYTPEFIPRLKVEVIVRDDQVDAIVSKVMEKVGGDPSAGGKIFVSEVSSVVDLATGKKGEEVI